MLLLLLARPAWVPGGLGGLLPSDEGSRALALRGGKGSTLGKTVVFPGRGSTHLESTSLGEGGGRGQGKTAVFPGRGRASLGSTDLGEGRGVVAWERLLSSPGGVAPSLEEGGGGSLGKIAVFPGRVAPAPAWGGVPPSLA